MNEVNAHKMVADLCEKMAQEVYEEAATKYPGWSLINHDRRAFVKDCAPTLREHARRCLAEQLGDPHVSEYDKERIYDALMYDKTIPQTGAWQLPRQPKLH